MTAEQIESIRYTVDVAAVTPDGRVLLIERGWPPYKGQLALPGGHVDLAETAPIAAVRELREETGLEVDLEDLRLVGVWDDPDRDPRGRYVSVVYAVDVPLETTARAGDDAAAVWWVPLHERDRLRDLAFDHAAIVYAVWQRELERMNDSYEHLDQQELAQDLRESRCPAAHPSDPSNCAGPVAVTVVDGTGAGADGCELHAARMLASLRGAQVYALPGATTGAAIRTFRTAGELPPYCWRQPIRR